MVGRYPVTRTIILLTQLQDCVSSMQLLADSNHRVTKAQVHSIVCIFPFLFLPAELRNIIYEFCLDFAGIELFFDLYYRRFEKHDDLSFTHPTPRVTTPTIFLINRQIFTEAMSVLSDSAIRFHHGLLRVPLLTNVVNESILKRISSIEITDDGHPILKSKTLTATWSGYIHLFQDLGWALADGHSLKKLVISFKDPRLAYHMSHCFSNAQSCAFRDDLKKAFESLRMIRGITKVSISGINAALAAELKAIMESLPRVSFADMPYAIRQMIWYWALDWSDISKQYALALNTVRRTGAPIVRPELSTPTALLLNRQYTQEALNALRRKPLTISFPDANLRWVAVPHISAFISRLTLRNVVHLEIKLDNWQWTGCLTEDFIAPFAEHHALRTLSVHLYDSMQGFMLRLRPYPDGLIRRRLQTLSALRGLERVEFTGNLPESYTDSLKAIMTRAPANPTVLPPPAV